MSVVNAMLLRVLTTSDLLAVYDAARPVEPIAATGFAELDSLTGGMLQTRVWIVVGTPGQGRSTLLMQWAAAVALARDEAVHLVTPRDGAPIVVSRLLACVGRVPLPHLTSHRLDPLEPERLRVARDRLATHNLHVFAKGESAYIPETDPFGPLQTPAIFIDDADMVSGVTPEWASACAGAGKFVLVSMPRHRVMVTADHEADLDAAWARVADVVLEVRHRGLANGAQRPGEAELALHYNRWGYVRTVAAQHLAHFSRFVEPASQS